MSVIADWGSSVTERAAHRDHRFSRLARSGGLIGALIGPLVLLPVDAAFANGDSNGPHFERAFIMNNGQEVNGCDGAGVEQTAPSEIDGWAQAWTYAFTGSSDCTSFDSVPTHYIDVFLTEMREGSVCSSNSAYNPSAGSLARADASCYAIPGDDYFSIAQGFWYKGTHCTADDECIYGFAPGGYDETGTIYPD
jgi:hypothetical protein